MIEAALIWLFTFMVVIGVFFLYRQSEEGEEVTGAKPAEFGRTVTKSVS